jgi:hypothetical protein
MDGYRRHCEVGDDERDDERDDEGDDERDQVDKGEEGKTLAPFLSRGSTGHHLYDDHHRYDGYNRHNGDNLYDPYGINEEQGEKKGGSFRCYENLEGFVTP